MVQSDRHGAASLIGGGVLLLIVFAPAAGGLRLLISVGSGCYVVAAFGPALAGLLLLQGRPAALRACAAVAVGTPG